MLAGGRHPPAVRGRVEPEHDWSGDGCKECGDWTYWGFKCNDKNGQCDYNDKFGGLLLDN